MADDLWWSSVATFDVRCYRGATIRTLHQKKKTLSLASADEPHIVFIHVGTNSQGHVVQHRCGALHDLQSLVNHIKERFPVAQVLVNNILPRCDWASLDDMPDIISIWKCPVTAVGQQLQM